MAFVNQPEWLMQVVYDGHVFLVVKKDNVATVIDPMDNYQRIAKGHFKLINLQSKKARAVLNLKSEGKSVNWDQSQTTNNMEKFRTICNHDNRDSQKNHPSFGKSRKGIQRFMDDLQSSQWKMANVFQKNEDHNVCQFTPISCWTIWLGFLKAALYGRYEQSGPDELVQKSCNLVNGTKLQTLL